MSSTPPTRARALLFRALPSILLIATLLAAEMLVRALLPPLAGLEVLVAAPDQLAQLVGRLDTEERRNRPRLFDADPLLFWRLRPDIEAMVWNQTLVSTNAQGLRQPSLVGSKRAGMFRIVCLGDSVTFGFRVPYAVAGQPHPVRPGLPYPRLLEDALRAQGRSVEVVTMAVPGYSSHQGLAWARRDLARLAPDLVVTSFGWNDVSAMPRSDADAMPVDRLHVAARTLLLHTQIGLRLVRARAAWRVGAAGVPPPASVPRVARDRYVANLGDIVTETQRLGSKVAVVGPVYRDAVTVADEAARMTEYRSALEAAMQARRIPYLEIRELTEAGHPDNTELFAEHVHPNEEGHRLFAARLSAFLETARLLPAP